MNWEYFSDVAYYDMWAVRPVGDTDFNSPRLFHFATEKEASDFKDLCESAIVAIPKYTSEDSDAIQFAQWLYNSGWHHFSKGKWRYTFEQGTSISDSAYEKHYVKTTEELYNRFKNRPTK